MIVSFHIIKLLTILCILIIFLSYFYVNYLYAIGRMDGWMDGWMDGI